jgi:hypothetical protein
LIITLFCLLFFIAYRIFELVKFKDYRYINILKSINDLAESLTFTSIILIFLFYYPVQIFSKNIDTKIFIDSGIVYYFSVLLFFFTILKILLFYEARHKILKTHNTEYLDKIQANVYKSLYSFSLNTRISKHNDSIFRISYIYSKQSNIEIFMSILKPNIGFFKFKKKTVFNGIHNYLIDIFKKRVYYKDQNFFCIIDKVNSKSYSLDEEDLKLLNIEDLKDIKSDNLRLLEILNL